MDGEQVAWAYWGGEMMGSLVAFDTETVASPDIDRKSPELVLATASDGAKTFVIRREDVPEFLLVNGGAEFVGHNVAFDFWVVLDWLEGLSHSLSRQVWWEVFDSGRAHDTMLLDQLVRLAKGDWAKGGVKPRNLEEVSLQYCPGHAANKEMGGEDPYRMRFGELLGVVNWGLMDPGFFDYAARDALATYHAYLALKKEAEALQSPWVPGEGEERYACYPDCVGRFGPLTEAVQVKGSVALRGVTLRGMCVDRDYALALDGEYRDRVKADWDFLLENYPGWFQYKKKTGELQRTPKGNFYSTSNKALADILESVATDLGIDSVKSKGKLGGTSTSEKAWSPYADRHPFIEKWVRVKQSNSVLKFFDVFHRLPPEGDGQYRVHPGYITLKNTGRTGCSGKDRKKGGRGFDYPNVQQTIRGSDFRKIYVASPGHKLLTIDYAAIELRTLAAVCYAMFGSSVLGDVIKAGRDPHAYTAAMINGVPYEEFLSWKATRVEKFKKDRQGAKACFHPDVELLTTSGWKRVADLGMTDEVAQFWPGVNRVDFSRPLSLTTRDDQPLVRVTNESVDLRVTPDHRMLGYLDSDYPSVCYPEDMNAKLRGIWNAGWKREGVRIGDLTPETLRQAVCVQADGAMGCGVVRFGFKRERKIERFRRIFAGENYSEGKSGDVTTFTVRWKPVWGVVLDGDKTFNVKNLLSLPLTFREAFLEEIEHWDSHSGASGKRFHYTSVEEKNTDALQAVAAVTGYKSSRRVNPARTTRHRDCHVVSVKKRNYSRSGTFKVNPLDGVHKVYCLSMPSSFVIVRDGGKVVCVGQCNFGVPGGLGPLKLSQYARAQYGVKMSEEEAAAFRTKLITEVYPEIGKYLESDPVLDVSRSLRLHPGFVREAVEGTFGEGKVGKGLYLVGRVAQGFPYYKGGDPYPAPLVIKASRLLCDLLEVSRRHDLLSLFESRPASWKEYAEGAGKRVYREVFGTTAVTLTGRVRKGCGYTDGKNTPFQSLAADGGKLALWELCKRGSRVVAFVHDEVIVEVPEASAEEEAKVVEEVLCVEMGKVLNDLVPVSCEWHLAKEWKK